MKREDWAAVKADEWLKTTPCRVEGPFAWELAELLREVRYECVCSNCGSVAIHVDEQ